MAFFKINSEAQEKRIFREMHKGIRAFKKHHASGMKVKNMGLFDFEGYYLSVQFWGETKTSDWNNVDWECEGLENFPTIIDADKSDKMWIAHGEKRGSLPWFSKRWLKSARAMFEEEIKPDMITPIYVAALNRVMDDPILDGIEFDDKAACGIFHWDTFRVAGVRAKTGRWVRKKIPIRKARELGDGLSLVGSDSLGDVKSFNPEPLKKKRRSKANLVEEAEWQERLQADLVELRKLTRRKKISKAEDDDPFGCQLEATRRFVASWPEDLLAARAVACVGRTALIHRWHGEFPEGYPVVEPTHQRQGARHS